MLSRRSLKNESKRGYIGDTLLLDTLLGRRLSVSLASLYPMCMSAVKTKPFIVGKIFKPKCLLLLKMELSVKNRIKVMLFTRLVMKRV